MSIIDWRSIDAAIEIIFGIQKDDPPGGQPGGSGTTRGWMRRPCRTQNPRSRRLERKALFQPVSVIAGADAAHVTAVGVELANPAAAAIAVVVVAIVSGDRAADHGGADEAGSNAPAEAPGFRLGGGGSDGAGDGDVFDLIAMENSIRF
jgi:hypothetical protein